MLSLPEKETYRNSQDYVGIPGHEWLMKHDNSFKYNSQETWEAPGFLREFLFHELCQFLMYPEARNFMFPSRLISKET